MSTRYLKGKSTGAFFRIIKKLIGGAIKRRPRRVSKIRMFEYSVRVTGVPLHIFSKLITIVGAPYRKFIEKYKVRGERYPPFDFKRDFKKLPRWQQDYIIYELLEDD